MATSTVGIKLDASTKDRLKTAAAELDRTPHWFMRQAIMMLITKVEGGAGIEAIVYAHQLEADTQKNSVTLRNRLNEDQ
jgi:predicted transcriptional regulator